MAALDVPEKDRFAEAVVRGLSERAGTRDGTAAVVEPVADNVPDGTSGHEDLRSCRGTGTLLVIRLRNACRRCGVEGRAGRERVAARDLARKPRPRAGPKQPSGLLSPRGP